MKQFFYSIIVFIGISSFAIDLQAAEISNVEVTNGETAADYVITWRTMPADAKVSVEWSYDPDFVAGEGTKITETQKNQLSWKAGGENKRRYFVISSDSGSAVKTAARLLPLEGGRNFRDLGGYKTTDGRTVKWGHVFRSGVMHSLTSSDYDYLSGLGIRTICDFRDKRERENEPTNWQAGDLDYQVFADPPERDPRENPMFATLLDPESNPNDVKLAMAEGYSHIVKAEKEGYTAMFAELVEGNIPLAFNCSAGKDRAGTAAALVLTALGVDEETVVHDYQLSDDYVDFAAEFMSPENRAEALAEEDHPYAFLFKLPEEKVAPLLSSDPIFIETSFADLTEEYGSVLNFIQTELDVSEQDLTTLRERLLF
ncbi:MAG: tyrosine-protein phosphatase [Pseudomonadota bacterium]